MTLQFVCTAVELIDAVDVAGTQLNPKLMITKLDRSIYNRDDAFRVTVNDKQFDVYAYCEQYDLDRNLTIQELEASLWVF